MLNNNEKSIFNTFLIDYDNELSNRCSNDLILPNTPENRELLKSAYLWNINGNMEEYELEYKKEVDNYSEVNLLGELERKEIIATDCLIFPYLCYKMGFKL